MLTKGCSTLITDIEQNTASPLVGLVNANDPVNDSDMPFAGPVTLHGAVRRRGERRLLRGRVHDDTGGSCLVGADSAAVRRGLQPRLPRHLARADVIPQTFGVNFSVLDGKNVVESLEHFEANNPPPAGVLRVPVGGQDVLVNLLTAGNFGDGVYYFRVKGYTLRACNCSTRECS